MAISEHINVRGKRLTLLGVYRDRNAATKEKVFWRKYNWKLLTLRENPIDGTYAVYGFLPGGKKAVLSYMATFGLSARLKRRARR